eukprot:1525784-Rhodomonas_salina.1
MTHVVDAATALSTHWQAMAESAKKTGYTFKPNIEDWTTPEEIKILTDLLEKREAGQVIPRMLVHQTTVYKNSVGTNFTKHVESGYATTEAFTPAKEIVWEDHLMADD